MEIVKKFQFQTKINHLNSEEEIKTENFAE